MPKNCVRLEKCGRTRALLEQMRGSGCKVSIATKSDLILRDLDLIKSFPDYLGLGLGASSLFEGRRFSNTADMDDYLTLENGVSGWYSEDEQLSLESRMEEFMFLGLRMVRGVSEKEFNKKFGEKIMAVYGEVIEKNQKLGLLVRKNGRIFLTEKGMDLANLVMSDFIL